MIYLRDTTCADLCHASTGENPASHLLFSKMHRSCKVDKFVWKDCRSVEKRATTQSVGRQPLKAPKQVRLKIRPKHRAMHSNKSI
ncbi:hypothetical protein AMS68_000320 [Peltaster fructicola]|uniref:Uncharacterized protein n=1 Tax=Peltaster fructicola TaxID=286661 RepID=A0A6H0XJ97_9PEZI|nr:hypothetical protein AMS68_000320 [Peltaster fructicola]